MKRPLLALLVFSAAAAVNPPAVEAQTVQVQPAPRWYIGGNVGRTDYGSCPSSASCDTRDTGYRLYGGYQFHPNIGVELGYVDLGKATANVGGLGGDVKADGWTAHVVGSIPVWNRFALFGRVGAIHGESKTGGAFGSHKDRGTDLAYGAGVRFGVTNNLDVSAEWDRFRFDTTNRDADVDLISVGLRFKF